MELNTLCLIAIFALAGVGIVAAIRSLLLGGWVLAILAGITLCNLGHTALGPLTAIAVVVSVVVYIMISNWGDYEI